MFRLRQAALLLACLAAALLLWRRLASSAERGVGASETDSLRSERFQEIETASVPRLSPASTRTSSTSEVNRCTILVIDKGSRLPVEGAAAVRPGVSRRTVEVTDPRRLGTTDGSGLLTLHPAALDGLPGLSVLADGFLPARIDAAALQDGFEEVCLEPGLELEVLCATADGDPVEGCLVMVSSWDPTGVPLTQATVPDDSIGRVCWARTGPEGVARLKGLAPGELGVFVEKDHYAVSEVRPGFRPVLPGEKRVEVELVELAVAAYEIDGDVEISETYEIPLGVRSGTSLAGIQQETDRIRGRFPRAQVAVVDMEAALPDELQVTALTRDRGLVRFQVPFIRARDFVSPRALDADGLSFGEPCFETDVRMLDPEGRELPADVLALEVPTGTGESLSIPLRNGRMWLPAGSFRLVSFLSSVAGRFSPEIMSLPGSAVIKTQVAVRACRFRVTDSDRNPVHQLSLSITQDGRTSTHFLLVPGSGLFLLPIGHAEVRARVVGLGEATRILQVEAGEGEQSCPIEIGS